jgi:hypothetical protein
MKSITKISGITVATLVTLTIVSMSLMESADAQASQRGRNNQEVRDTCKGNESVVGVCVGGLNANVPVNANIDVSCSVLVLASADRCQNR